MADILDRLQYVPSKVTGPGQVEIDNDKLRELLADASAEIERLTKVIHAAEGYLFNAKIDLQTGATKKTAIATMDGGLRMIRAALTGNREGD